MAVKAILLLVSLAYLVNMTFATNVLHSDSGDLSKRGKKNNPFACADDNGFNWDLTKKCFFDKGYYCNKKDKLNDSKKGKDIKDPKDECAQACFCPDKFAPTKRALTTENEIMSSSEDSDDIDNDPYTDSTLDDADNADDAIDGLEAAGAVDAVDDVSIAHGTKGAKWVMMCDTVEIMERCKASIFGYHCTLRGELVPTGVLHLAKCESKCNCTAVLDVEPDTYQAFPCMNAAMGVKVQCIGKRTDKYVGEPVFPSFEAGEVDFAMPPTTRVHGQPKLESKTKSTAHHHTSASKSIQPHTKSTQRFQTIRYAQD